MQIVIDLPEETYRKIKENIYDYGDMNVIVQNGTPLPKGHGRLIDADSLHDATYHRAFETDGDTMWQSGCWVRYRAIEQVQNSQPTIIEADKEHKDVGKNE